MASEPVSPIPIQITMIRSLFAVFSSLLQCLASCFGAIKLRTFGTTETYLLCGCLRPEVCLLS